MKKRHRRGRESPNLDDFSWALHRLVDSIERYSCFLLTLEINVSIQKGWVPLMIGQRIQKNWGKFGQQLILFSFIFHTEPLRTKKDLLINPLGTSD